ncbi:hypothetical protein [Enterobacter hormaechei]|uniref:hypothetical protein n=1 Tax=Enterobacter hormaechei TaxID=158836 RepID=UPI003F422B52
MPEVKDYLKLFDEQDKHKSNNNQIAKTEDSTVSQQIADAKQRLSVIRNDIAYYSDLIREKLFSDPYHYGDLFGAEFSKTINDAVKAILMREQSELLNDEIKQLAIIGRLKQ